MDVRIGVTQNPKEIGLEMPDDTDVEALQGKVDKAFADGGALWLTDRKGRQVGEHFFDHRRQVGVYILAQQVRSLIL